MPAKQVPPWLKAPAAPELTSCDAQLPYLHLLQALSQACPASTVVLLELPAVSLRLGQRAADVDAIAAAAVAAAVQHASLPACFVAHSFGTFCVSRICQLHPAAVQSVVRAASATAQGCMCCAAWCLQAGACLLGDVMADRLCRLLSLHAISVILAWCSFGMHGGRWIRGQQFVCSCVAEQAL